MRVRGGEEVDMWTKIDEYEGEDEYDGWEEEEEF